MARQRVTGSETIRHRWADEIRSLSEQAPRTLRQRIEALRALATDRKLLLLECAILRNAPFSDDGQTIWQLLPTFKWFTHCRKSDPKQSLDGHQAIETTERAADGLASADEIEDARVYYEWTEYAAEADRFGYDEARLVGSELRYGVADWLAGLHSKRNGDRRNVLDYYLTTRDALRYYAWAEYRSLPPAHRGTVLVLIDDIFGDPFRPPTFSPSWRTDTALTLARTMYESREFGATPILADALQDAGCDNDDILAHCRDTSQVHVRGCWVCDLVLGKT